MQLVVQCTPSLMTGFCLIVIKILVAKFYSSTHALSFADYFVEHFSCPADNSFDPDDAIMIDRNYDVKYSTFKFRSFVWTQDQEQAIYVYCDVTICHNDVGSGCASQVDNVDITCS